MEQQNQFYHLAVSKEVAGRGFRKRNTCEEKNRIGLGNH